LGHECLLNSTFEKGGNFDSCERISAGKCINGAQGNLFWPPDSLLDHKSMERLHGKHLHKTDKEGLVSRFLLARRTGHRLPKGEDSFLLSEYYHGRRVCE